MCKKDPDCFNSKTLVVDTNFLDQLNRTVKEELRSTTWGRPLEEQRPIFLTRVKKIVENVGNCGSGLVFTSEKVYNDEIDITELDSALRTSDPDFDGLCMDEKFVRRLTEVYQDRVRIEDLFENELRSFQRLLSEDIGLADASLALLAAKLSQDQDVILITDDLGLRKAIKALRTKKKILLEGQSLTTENLHYMGSLLFLRSLHFCCEMSNGCWRSAVWSFFTHLYQRYEGKKISHDKFEQHYEYANQCLTQMRADCEAKKKREEDKEFSQIFGVDNG